MSPDDLGARTHALLLELRASLGDWQEVERVLNLCLHGMAASEAAAQIGGGDEAA